MSSEAPPLGVETAVFSLCPHTVLLLHVCVLLSKDTGPDGRGPTTRTARNLHGLFKDFNPKYKLHLEVRRGSDVTS